MIDILTRIEQALAQVAQCNSDRGRMVRKIYLDKHDLAEWKALKRGFELRHLEVAASAYPKSSVFNKCGQSFPIIKFNP